MTTAYLDDVISCVVTQDTNRIRGPHAHNRRRFGPAGLVHLHSLPNSSSGPWPTLVFD